MQRKSLHDGYRMEGRTKLRKFLKVATWPLIVIGALNIERVSEKTGMDRLLDWLLLQAPQMSGLLAFLRSDLAFHIFLVLAGACAYAWINSFLGRPRKEEPKRTDPAGLAEACEDAMLILSASKRSKLSQRIIAWRNAEPFNELCARLCKAGAPDAPPFDPSNPESINAAIDYYGAMVGFLRQKARSIETQDEGSEPRLLPNIGVGSGPIKRIPMAAGM